MEDMGQSAEFGKFLKAMRSRLTPENAGIASGSGGRRVPGLRREEIARLADVSTDYYTRLEQGRNIHPSRAVLHVRLRIGRGEPCSAACVGGTHVALEEVGFVEGVQRAGRRETRSPRWNAP